MFLADFHNIAVKFRYMQVHFGKVLRRFRKEQKLNQQKVADHLFVSRPTYNRYEQDIVEIPISKLFALAVILNFDPIELLRTNIRRAAKDEIGN